MCRGKGPVSLKDAIANIPFYSVLLGDKVCSHQRFPTGLLMAMEFRESSD
jgi:hypothetical protein